MKPKISTTDKNILTFTISALLLTALILGIVFTYEDYSNKDSLPSLDIILSKQKSIDSPDKADFLAQNNQQGGGNSEKRVRPQNIKKGMAVDDQGNAIQEQVDNIPEKQKQKNTDLVSNNNAQIKVESAKHSKEIKTKPTKSQKRTKKQKLAKMVNNISHKIESYAKKPKTKYISASTKSYEFANYMYSWVKKIERNSNLNYPDEARKRGFVGTLIMTVGINAEGTIKNIRISKSSGYQSIDDAAKHLVQISGPFDPIPDTKNKIDILYITRTWQFLPGNKLKQK